VHGENVHILVYVEKINTEQLIILHYNVMAEEQKYIPAIHAEHVDVIVESTIEKEINERIEKYFHVQPVYHPLNSEVRGHINGNEQIKSFIATTDWTREQS